MFAQQVGRRQRFQSRHVARAGHNDIGLPVRVIAGPIP